MKRNLIKFILAGMLFASCQKSSQNDDASRELMKLSTMSSKKTARSLVERNEFIDLDINKLKSQKLTDDDIIKSKAAVFRFYKHVQLKDGQYFTDLKRGQEVNISEELFLALNENLNQMNASIKELKQKGQKVQIDQVDEKYLSSLLN